MYTTIQREVKIENVNYIDVVRGVYFGDKRTYFSKVHCVRFRDKETLKDCEVFTGTLLRCYQFAKHFSKKYNIVFGNEGEVKRALNKVYGSSIYGKTAQK